MSKSPQEMAQSMIDNLPAKTGKSLQQWLSILANSDLEKHGQIVSHLKADHGVTHGFANLIAQKHLAGDTAAPSADTLIAAQYSGPKEHLRPLYDAVVRTVCGFGDDVEVSPKKSYVSIRRSKQFALVQASTKNRVDLGINLKGKKPAGRLEESGSFNAMVSHRVRLSAVNDVDEEIGKWLRQAYDAA